MKRSNFQEPNTKPNRPNFMNRRKSIMTGLAGVTAVALNSAANAADETKDGDKKKKKIDFLFVQHSASATLKDGVLTMKNVASQTLYFSDRPDRIAGRVTTEHFVAKWGEGDDSFESNPPNAVLSVVEKPEPVDVVVVLKNPRLEAGNLLYDVEVTDGDKAVTGETSSLFIDIIGRPITPLSVAGVARRTTRRTVRRFVR